MDGTNLKKILVGVILTLIVLMTFGLLWAFALGPQNSSLVSGSLGWYLFSYAMGLTMIVLPCTLPLAFVIVPMVLKKGAGKGFGLALSFGLGVAITLSLYGILAAVVGKLAIGSLATPLETVKNWVYFIAGIFAYLFALSEVGLMKFHMPTYKGAAPAFIQKQGDYLKALLLGLFLGNIGVGCPHPATPLILTEIASSGDLFYGWSLFLVHALGRVIPLLLLALLAILGVNALSWLVAKKDKLERATGWFMIFVAGFILVLGLFTHDWWVNSGQHTLFESLTQEAALTGALADRLGTGQAHGHGLEVGTGLFGLPLTLGNWVLVGLWVLPIWWYYKKKKQEFMEKNLLRSRFWAYVTLSLLLVVTFVYYLPTRFLLQAEMPHADEMMEEMMMTDHAVPIYREAREVTVGLAVDLLPASPAPRGESPATSTVGVPTELRFFVNDRPSGAPVPNYVLEIEREKLMHVIGVRDDLEEFFHIHPVPTIAPGVFAISHTFTAPGSYKLWAEVKQGGVGQVFGQMPFMVAGDGSVGERVSRPDFARQIQIGDYRVALDVAAPVPVGHAHELSVIVFHPDGRVATLDDYLGAKMHLAIIKDDWTQFLHTHSEDDSHHSMIQSSELWSRTLASAGHSGEEMETLVLPGQNLGQDAVNFHVNFPTPGLYRAFAQFRPADAGLPADEALTAAFWIEVAEAEATTSASSPVGVQRGASRTLAGNYSAVWWQRLIVSLIAIVILGLIVKRLIKVKV